VILCFEEGDIFGLKPSNPCLVALLIAAPPPGETAMHNDLLAMAQALLDRGLPADHIFSLHGQLDRSLVLAFLRVARRRMDGWTAGSLFVHVSGLEYGDRRRTLLSYRPRRVPLVGSLQPGGGPQTGGRIVTASEDGTAKVWNAETGDEILSLSLSIALFGSRPVKFAAFSLDGSRIVTASDDGTARVWLMPDELLAVALSRVQRDPPIFTVEEKTRFGIGE